MVKQRAACSVCSMAAMMVRTKVDATVCRLAECLVWNLVVRMAWRMAALTAFLTADLMGGSSVGSWGGRRADHLENQTVVLKAARLAGL